MTKRKIKVLKRDSAAQPPPPPEPKQPAASDRGISNAVKSWISDYRKREIA